MSEHNSDVQIYKQPGIQFFFLENSADTYKIVKKNMSANSKVIPLLLKVGSAEI